MFFDNLLSKPYERPQYNVVWTITLIFSYHKDTFDIWSLWNGNMNLRLAKQEKKLFGGLLYENVK